jgi:hypothetical protein
VWAWDDYEKLRPYDAPTGAQPTAGFSCHATPEHYCHGWAVVHSSRGHEYELLALRINWPADGTPESDVDTLFAFNLVPCAPGESAPDAGHGDDLIVHVGRQAVEAVGERVEVERAAVLFAAQAALGDHVEDPAVTETVTTAEVAPDTNPLDGTEREGPGSGVRVTSGPILEAALCEWVAGGDRFGEPGSIGAGVAEDVGDHDTPGEVGLGGITAVVTDHSVTLRRTLGSDA